MNILTSHRTEWQESGVAESIIEANIRSVEGTQVFNLLYSNPTHLNGGRPDAKTRRAIDRYIVMAGWAISGVDPLNDWKPRNPGAEKEWTRFKPDVPVMMPGWKKPAKYLSPNLNGVHAERAIYLEVPRGIWEFTAEIWNVPIEENDYTYWHWVKNHKIPTTLNEGEKKVGCLITNGYPAIALPGINSGYRKIGNRYRLIADLAWLDTKGQHVIISFDYRAGNKFWTKETRAALRTGQCFRSGAEVSIAFLPGEEKGVDDWVMAGGNLKVLFDSVMSLNQVAREMVWSLDKEPSLSLCREYLGEIEELPETGTIGIKSPRGTGKTQSLTSIVDRAQSQGDRILMLSHRIVLGKSICGRIGLPWVGEDSDYEYGNLFGFGLCVDSLHPESQAHIEADQWHNTIVIIDEIEQVLQHLLHSTTLQEHRATVLATLGEILTHAKLIVAQDADLTGLSLDYIKNFRSNEEPFIVENTYNITPWDVQFFDTSRKGGRKDDPSAAIAQAIGIVRAGGKICLMTDSQKAESRWGTINLEQLLAQEFPDRVILRIDSETISDPTHAAYRCADNINEVLSRVDIALISPALSTGVSINLRGHFAAVVGVFQGIGTANDAMQSLARVREAVPRLVWARRVGVARYGSGDTAGWKIVDLLNKRNDANRRFAGLHADALKIAASQTPSIEAWADLAARHNLDSWQFRSAIRDCLEAEGHVLTLTEDYDEALTENLSHLRIESTLAEAIEVMNAEEISETEYQKLRDKKEKNPTERLQEKRYSVEHRYGVGVTPPLYILDKQGWDSKLRLHYYLTIGNPFLSDRDRRVADKAEATASFMPDVRLYSARIKFLERMGVTALLEGEYQADSPEIEEIDRRCKAAPFWVKAIAGFNPSNMSPIQLVGGILELIGYEWKGRQHRVNGLRVRSYTAVPQSFEILEACGLGKREPENLRDRVFTHWLERDRAYEEKLKQAENERSEAEAAIETDWTEVRESIVAGLVDNREAIGAYQSIVPAEQWRYIVRSLPKMTFDRVRALI